MPEFMLAHQVSAHVELVQIGNLVDSIIFRVETNIQSILMSVAEMQKMDTASQKMGLEANKGPGMTKPS